MNAWMKRALLVVAVVVLWNGVVQAQNLATLVCTPYASTGSETQVNLGTTTVANTTLKVSYFDVNLTAAALNIGSQSSGAGAGKVTFQPFTVHTSLSNFDVLATAIASGTLYSECLLKTTTHGGTSQEFDFKLVSIMSLDAVGGDASRAGNATETAYTSVQFQYGGLQVRTLNPQDNGGTGTLPTTGGWNRITNTSSSTPTPTL